MANNISPRIFFKATINIRVLVAPLDWGLGHATRCIPVIRSLLAAGCQVIIAVDETQEHLLRLEFPAIDFIRFKGYRVRYSKRFLIWRLTAQLSGIKKAIELEHIETQKLVQTHRIDWIISDNRYGLWSTVPAAFITHQLQVKLPSLLKWLEPFVQRKLYGYINNFDACWVPDLPDKERSLSGLLGHPAIKPTIPVWYTGWLSRFSPSNIPIPNRYKCLVILSGPEPQRTILESILLKQLRHSVQPMILVRGLPSSKTGINLPENIKVYNHLPAAEMLSAFQSSEFIISRSGYSTVMDAFTLQKKCIFIPTPGQTEQEYIGKRLAENGMALVYLQENFDLSKALEDAKDFQFHFPLNSMNNLLEMAIDHFITTHFSDKTISSAEK